MILVLGASGTVGSELIRQLQAAGAPFKGGYHSEERAQEARDRGIDPVIIDYAKPHTLEPSLRGIDHLFLLGAGGGDQTQQEINVVEAAVRAGVEHIVKLSVWGAEGEDFSFAKIHRPVERAIEQSPLEWTFLRPNGFMQNIGNYYAPTIRAQGAFYGNIGDAQISHVDVRDIAAVALKALTQPGHTGHAYPLTGPDPLTYAEIASKLSKAAGREVKYINLPDDQLKQGMTAAGIPAYYADLLLDLNRYYREGRASTVTDDVKRVTGRDPISFDRYAADNAKMFV
jgi:uncharacterized protein YbjT (DUF2867 family)